MSTKWDPSSQMPNLRGKVALVTGGNAGIGYETTKGLALKGAKVYIAGRKESRLKAAIDKLLTENTSIGKTQLEWLILDLADLKSVLRAADELKTREQKLDILINNAGMATFSKDTIGDGWDQHMATNHIGTFVFTNGVLPLLKVASRQKDADVRIVTLSSNAVGAFLPTSFRFNYDKTNVFKEPVTSHPALWRYVTKNLFNVDMIRYAASKAANAMFAQKLQQVLDAEGVPIISTAVHTGGVITSGADDVLGGFLVFALRSTRISVQDGAVTSLFAATAPDVRTKPSVYAGKYLIPYGKVEECHALMKENEQVTGLWDNTEAEVNKYLKKNGLPPLPAW